MRRAQVLALGVALATGGRAASTPSAAAQEVPKGRIVDDVRCEADASQSYALYVPSSYTPEKAWSLLLAFHPRARGRVMVEKYLAPAERYGYIVAGSNTSRNGPWEASGAAVRCMSRDLGRRFAIDAQRLYLTGHSGGARLAMQVALGPANPIAGVIASLVWLAVDNAWLAWSDTSAMMWIALVGLGLILGIGLSWSHFRRRITGQVDVEDDGAL